MAGDDFRRSFHGRPALPTARAWNDALAAAAALKRTDHDRIADLSARLNSQTQVLVSNDSGSARDRFDVLGIDVPLILPADNLGEFQRRVVLSGVMPVTASASKFAVLLDALPDGAVGRAVVSGVVPGRVLVAASGGFAAAISGDATQLQQQAVGAAQILWQDPTVTAGGTADAVLRLGHGRFSSPLTTKGDVWGYDTADDRVPVGSNGEVLTADSTQALGVKWAAAGGALTGGSAALSGDYNAGATTAMTAIGASFPVTLAAGTYLFIAQVVGYVSVSNENATLYARLFNVTQGVQIGQAALVAHAEATGTLDNTCTAPLVASAVVNANDQITIQAGYARVGGGSLSVFVRGGDPGPSSSTYGTYLSYVKTA